jgi:hypothetical protein
LIILIDRLATAASLSERKKFKKYKEEMADYMCLRSLSLSTELLRLDSVLPPPWEEGFKVYTKNYECHFIL